MGMQCSGAVVTSLQCSDEGETSMGHVTQRAVVAPTGVVHGTCGSQPFGSWTALT